MSERDADAPETLPENAEMSAYQRYIHQLERFHGWLDVDLVHNCFLMGEEIGELFKAVRRYERLWNDRADHPADGDVESRKAHVAEELVDVMNYVLAIANRLDIDVEQAFRDKNARNVERRWR